MKGERTLTKNIAVVGCGYWGKNLIRNFNELKALYAICDSDEERLAAFAQQYPSVSAQKDFDTILSDSRVEGVVISTPAVTHYNLAKKALQAEKDVFVEKPIALNYKDGEELVGLAEEKNKILMVGHILEYHTAVEKLKELVKQGELGKISYIYSNRLNLGKFRTEENILWSFAPHDISVILALLNEMPEKVSAHGGNYLNPHVADVTVTTMDFASGAKAHIFVSWLHPYKEQKLVIIGDKKMVMFDDVSPDDKLLAFDHKIDWIERAPIPRPEQARPIPIEKKEPLREECSHFIDCIRTRSKPRTDGASGLRVLKILEASQKSLKENGKVYGLGIEKKEKYFVHPSSIIDDHVQIGEDTKIWHFSHVLKNTNIGKKCSIGQNVMIGPNVDIGDNVKIQNNVSVYEGVVLEDDVFCGPSMVFTNVTNPRSHWPRKDEFKKTLVKKGSSIGANATIICGNTIGRYAFIGAGALVNKDLPDFALVYGVPARVHGWMCYCGVQLDLSASPDSKEKAECGSCGRKYKKDRLKVEMV
jgi:UDP-2-acetamido-3-amino-2,3-dideoxy-glucuronate N-acetyltransferase